MSNVAIQVRGPLAAVFRPDGESMIDPKWFVGAGAVVALALIYNYSFAGGVAASALFAVLASIYLWISIRLAPGRNEPTSERAAMFNRFARLSRNRRSARLKELGAQRGTDAS